MKRQIWLERIAGLVGEDSGETAEIIFEAVERKITELQSDDYVYDRFCSSNTMIDRYCDGCDQKCKDTCDGRRYRV